MLSPPHASTAAPSSNAEIGRKSYTAGVQCTTGLYFCSSFRLVLRTVAPGRKRHTAPVGTLSRDYGTCAPWTRFGPMAASRAPPPTCGFLARSPRGGCDFLRWGRGTLGAGLLSAALSADSPRTGCTTRRITTKGPRPRPLSANAGEPPGRFRCTVPPAHGCPTVHRVWQLAATDWLVGPPHRDEIRVGNFVVHVYSGGNLGTRKNTRSIQDNFRETYDCT